MKTISRRSFLSFLGYGFCYTLSAPFLPPSGLRCLGGLVPPNRLPTVAPSDQDEVVVADGLTCRVLISCGDAISPDAYFGDGNDFIAFLPSQSGHGKGFLWINHEYVNPLFISGHAHGDKRTEKQIRKELYHVGGSFLQVQQDKASTLWEVVRSAKNFRVTAATPIPFSWKDPIYKSRTAMGTLANCSGGMTPWGTFLTCEENYEWFYGERDRHTGRVVYDEEVIGWHEKIKNPPEHYGWVVEIDPWTRKYKKHVALGRCAHECAVVKVLKDGRLVVYMADDKENECLYKFVSRASFSLSRGTLYVASLAEKRWKPLRWEDNPALRATFSSQTEVLIYLREASKVVGGTPMDRPEGIAIDPVTGHVVVALTNNKATGNHFGSLLKIMEGDGDHAAHHFDFASLLTGGRETGFACPDNVLFDSAGNLWFTSDISGHRAGRGVYAPFKNNGLFLVPRSGPQQDEVLQIASAPNDAEFSGPCFSPDGKTLFLSVQHPGETTTSLQNPTSRWPGGAPRPKSSVITLQGAFFDALSALAR